MSASRANVTWRTSFILPGDTVDHLYIPQEGKVWTDTARTTLATAGDPVGSIEDQAGDNYAEQGTTANKPTLKEDANGNLYLDFVANEDFLEVGVTATKATKVSTIPGVGAFSAEVEPGLESRSNVRIQSTTAGTLVRTGTYSKAQRADWASALDQRGKDVADAVTSFKNYFRDEPLTDYDAHAQDTSGVTDMAVMFTGTSVSDLSALSGWDTSSVTRMGYMFQNTSVSDPSSISAWDVASVTNFRGFLKGAPLDSAKTGDMLDGWTDGSPNLASDMQSGVALGIQNADYSQMNASGQDALESLRYNANWTVNATNVPADVLAPAIHAEQDRAQAGGATIESGVYTDLIQPVYDVLDGAGEWSNVVFFGVAGVRDVASGSVSKMYDQSGGQNDASQSTSSKRPTDTTDADFSGHAVSSFDASDDALDTGLSLRQDLTILAGVKAASDWTTDSDFHAVLSSYNYNGVPDGVHAVTWLGVNDKWYSVRGSSQVVKSISQTPPQSGTRLEAYSPRNSTSGHIRKNASDITGQTASDSSSSESNTALIGSSPLGGQVFDGPIAYVLVINSDLARSVRDDLDSKFAAYY
jgi:hypothetical protein